MKEKNKEWWMEKPQQTKINKLKDQYDEGVIYTYLSCLVWIGILIMMGIVISVISQI